MNTLALVLGWIVMGIGGITLTLAIVWIGLDYLTQWLSRGTAWFDVICRMHKERAFRWQKP